MTSKLIVCSNLMPCVAQFPAAVGSRMVPGAGVGTLRLPTDPIGTTTVTFSGINANSEIRVYLPDGTAVAGIEDCASDQVLSWSVYSSGNPNNTVTIRIVSTAYKLKEFTYVSSVGATSLPVQQEPDKWYSNP